MPNLASFWNLAKFLGSQWWAWLIWVTLVGLLWYQTSVRKYKVRDGTLYVKEGLSRWEPLEEHFKNEHPLEYEKLKKEYEKQRKEEKRK